MRYRFWGLLDSCLAADESSRWYIVKANAAKKRASRFRMPHQVALVTMSTDEIMALTRGE